MRGLSQSEGTPDSQTELKAAWNSWARKLCEVEGGAVALRSKCLLQQTVLQLQQQQYTKALDSSNEVLALLPENKHAKALLATSQQKAGKKKAAGVTVTELCADFQKAEDPAVQTNEELATRWSSPSRCSSRCTARRTRSSCSRASSPASSDPASR